MARWGKVPYAGARQLNVPPTRNSRVRNGCRPVHFATTASRVRVGRALRARPGTEAARVIESLSHARELGLWGGEPMGQHRGPYCDHLRHSGRRHPSTRMGIRCNQERCSARCSAARCAGAGCGGGSTRRRHTRVVSTRPTAWVSSSRRRNPASEFHRRPPGSRGQRLPRQRSPATDARRVGL